MHLEKTLPMILVALLGAVCGCSKGDAPPAPSANASSSAAPAAPTTGLDAPGNNPTIVAAVKKTIADCGANWKDKSGFESCKTFSDFMSLPLELGKDDATFVNLLEDADAKVRKHGIEGLHRWGSAYRNDKALAERVVAALEKEKTPALDGQLAAVTTKIDAVALGLGARLKTFVLKADTSNDVKEFFAAFWGGNSSKSNEVAYELAKALAAGGSVTRVKRAGLQGLDFAYDAHADEACKLWFAAANSTDVKLAASAMALVTGAGGRDAQDEDAGWFSSGGGGGHDKICKEAEEVVALIAKRAKDGKINEATFVWALSAVVDAKTPAPLRGKATAALKAIIENKANGWTRSNALNQLVAKNPKEKAFAKKFASDPDLKDTVKAILAQK